ncbi:cytochrome P450 [Cellvibrio sp. ARAG 10.3]|uniref:cytochrome P450 n=1 Tax=Cellvibrio sp. ARAG 10.3 TaxID=3451358 RepID=UPI003F466DD6
MSAIPREKAMDGALGLLRDGNLYITRRCERYQTDIFSTRLLFKKTFCIVGEEAAWVFYCKGRLTRRGAIPPTVLHLLQDKGSVATLDDKAHHWRKRMMMSLMTPDNIQRLVDLVDERWRRSVYVWQARDEVDLFDEIERILCWAVCEWCGVGVADGELSERTREISAMIDGAGSIGPRQWRGALLRRRSEKWIAKKIQEERAKKAPANSADPLHVIATHRDANGTLLTPEVAAVEVLNMLRPTVAVGRFILFAAIALHQYPECRPKLARGGEEYLENFVQEVRRFYPFFPFIGGVVREAFHWRDCRFPVGTRIMLDVYGTNHDARIWQAPYQFQPERFRDWQDNAFSFIAQGGGGYYVNHRCAGEQLTIALMKRCVQLLINTMDYDVIAQDTDIDMRRMPALPKKPFLLRNVRLPLPLPAT